MIKSGSGCLRLVKKEVEVLTNRKQQLQDYLANQSQQREYLRQITERLNQSKSKLAEFRSVQEGHNLRLSELLKESQNSKAAIQRTVARIEDEQTHFDTVKQGLCKHFSLHNCKLQRIRLSIIELEAEQRERPTQQLLIRTAVCDFLRSLDASEVTGLACDAEYGLDLRLSVIGQASSFKLAMQEHFESCQLEDMFIWAQYFQLLEAAERIFKEPAANSKQFTISPAQELAEVQKCRNIKLELLSLQKDLSSMQKTQLNLCRVIDKQTKRIRHVKLQIDRQQDEIIMLEAQTRRGWRENPGRTTAAQELKDIDSAIDYFQDKLTLRKELKVSALKIETEHTIEQLPLSCLHIPSSTSIEYEMPLSLSYCKSPKQQLKKIRFKEIKSPKSTTINSSSIKRSQSSAKRLWK